MDMRKSPTFTWIYAFALTGSLCAVVAGVDLLRQSSGNSGFMTGAALLGSGCVGLLGILITLPIALDRATAREEADRHHYELIRSLSERLEGISVLMNLISEQQLISDRAKSVAFREKDIEAVRRALTEEMARQDWEAALLLTNEIEIGFGYKQEADGVRAQIQSKRNENQRRQYVELLAPIDRHIKSENWGGALQEAQNLMESHPEDAHIQRLPEEIENRRQTRKQQLRESWQEAVDRHDVDGSIEILKRLDLYLTPAEAESMAEIARNVFKEKRESLRTCFALAVQEHKWTEAIRLGDEIINDFPNTRIAQEVREKMDALRQRAAEPAMTA